MHFQERDEGEFRIYAGALESPRGNGFVASVILIMAAVARVARLTVIRDCTRVPTAFQLDAFVH